MCFTWGFKDFWLPQSCSQQQLAIFSLLGIQKLDVAFSFENFPVCLPEKLEKWELLLRWMEAKFAVSLANTKFQATIFDVFWIECQRFGLARCALRKDAHAISQGLPNLFKTIPNQKFEFEFWLNKNVWVSPPEFVMSHALLNEKLKKASIHNNNNNKSFALEILTYFLPNLVVASDRDERHFWHISPAAS